MRRFTLLGLALIVLCKPVDAKDYITRGDALFDQSLPVFKRYDREVKRILHRAWKRDVIVRAVHLPPFDPEWIIGVVRSQSGYRAFQLEASYFIWQAMNDEKEKLPAIHGIYRERPLDEASALRIAALWRAVLSAPQNYGKDPTMYGIARHSTFSSVPPLASILPATRHTCSITLMPRFSRPSQASYTSMRRENPGAGGSYSKRFIELSYSFTCSHVPHLTKRCS